MTLALGSRKNTSYLLRQGVALSALAVGALACGGGGLFGPPEPTLPAPRLWRQTVTVSYITVPIVVDGMLIYQGQSSDIAQDVFGRDAATGELRWTFDLSTNSTYDDPLATEGGLVFVQHSVQAGGSTDTGYLLALDARSGNQRWSLPLGEDWQFLYPTAADGRLFVETDAGAGQRQLSAVEAATGDPLWDYPLLWNLSVRPVVVDGLVIAAQSDSAGGDDRQSLVFALDAATGEPHWAFDVAGNGLQRRLAVGDGRLYYFTFDGTAVALEAATGQQLWATPLGATEPNDPHKEPDYADGQLFAATGDGTIHALDGVTGEEVWSYPMGEALSTNLTTGSGRVFVGTREGYLRVLDATTGALQWEVRNQLRQAFPDNEYYPPVETAPLVSDGVAYVILNDKLVALQVTP